MTLDTLRAICLAHKGATEELQWGEHLLFKVGGKMFCITNLNDANDTAFKVTDEDFECLPALGIFIPAPHLQRAKWLKVIQGDQIKLSEWRERIATSYSLVKSKLPKKLQAELAS